MNIPQCGDCKHCDPQTWGISNCRAFPNGIPRAIMKGLHNHIHPYPGDNGILFEPEDEAAALAWAEPPLQDSTPG